MAVQFPARRGRYWFGMPSLFSPHLPETDLRNEEQLVGLGEMRNSEAMWLLIHMFCSLVHFIARTVVKYYQKYDRRLVTNGLKV